MGILSMLFGSKAESAPTGGGGGGIPKVIHPLRGWSNLGLYEVHGINPKTGRSNKKTCQCLSENEAREWALSAGLLEPITVKEIQSRMVSEWQADYCRKLGIRDSLQGLSMVDANALIWRHKDGDARKINGAEWAAACAAGILVSALCGPTHYKYIMRCGDWRYREE